MTWLEDYRCDGLRFDATVFITAVDGPPKEHRLPEGWSFMAWLNDEIHARQPWKLTIAEDLQRDTAITAPTAEGGAGFNAQWDAGFIHALRPALTAGNDADRDIAAVVDAITGEGRGAPLTRVIYTESHDDVANGQVRVPESITPGAADSWWAKKRSALGSVLVLTAPGIPMLFQGQELLEDRWFDDTVALDWAKAQSNDGILRLHRDLIALRRTRDDDGATRGLRGQHVDVLRADRDAKIIAFHRWADGGPHDDTVIIANFADRHVTNLRLGLPARGRWRVRLNSDSGAYAQEFGGHEAFDLDADGGPLDGCRQSGLVSVGPYSAVVLSRED
jgi:1,4-alpha-glucan branching enzyme